MYSLLGWTTRGRHHTPVFRMFDWPLHRDFSLLFAINEVGSFTCIGCDSPIHGTDGLESPPKDLAMRIKRLAKGRYCRGGIWTHAEPPVWKFAVYTLALRRCSVKKKERNKTLSDNIIILNIWSDPREHDFISSAFRLIETVQNALWHTYLALNNGILYLRNVKSLCVV